MASKETIESSAPDDTEKLVLPPGIVGLVIWPPGTIEYAILNATEQNPYSSFNIQRTSGKRREKRMAMQRSRSIGDF